ncbi:MAG: hypothetical protein ACYC25_10680, partial [Paludibacter sp.]
GKLENYSFNHEKNSHGLFSHGFVYDYLLWIENYQKPFRIGANNIGHENDFNFKENIFKEDVNIGDEIKVKVYKNQLDKIDNIDDILIYSLRKENENFLLTQNTLKKENEKVGTISAIFFFVGSIVFLILYFRKKRKEKTLKTIINSWND